MSILEYLKGPTKEEVLEYFQKKNQDGEINLLKFYEVCKDHDIPGGPSIEEVNEDLKKKIDIGEFDILKYLVFCEKYSLYIPSELETYLNNLFQEDKIDILTYFDICKNKNLTGGPRVEDIIRNFTGHPDELLRFAINESSTACAESTLKAGSNASARAKSRALILASKKGNLALVQLMIDNGVNIRKNKDEALRVAAYHGQLAVIELLVAKKGDIHAMNEQALSFAATCHSNNRIIDGVNPNQGNLDVVKYLYENGANIELSSNSYPNEWNNIMDNSIIEYLDDLGYNFRNR